MAEIENSKLAIIGAGAVGTSIAYAAIIRGSAREVVISDVDAARVEAEMLDLAHGTLFTGSTSIAGGDDLDIVIGAHVIVITAGAKQHAGQSRLDLASTNVDILRDLMPKLVARAPDAVYLLVTNPCDVMVVAAHEISGLPSGRVFGSGTVLDTSRLRWLLAKRVGVSASSVHAMIVGEHGDSEFPLWSQASVGPVPILEWRTEDVPPLDLDELDRIATDVRNAAYRVIAGKGATNYAIGLSVARIAEAVLRDEGAVLPVSSMLTDYRGISGVALSIPSVVDARGISHVIDAPFSPSELELLTISGEAVRKTLRPLGL